MVPASGCDVAKAQGGEGLDEGWWGLEVSPPPAADEHHMPEKGPPEGSERSHRGCQYGASFRGALVRGHGKGRLLVGSAFARAGR